MNKTNELDKKKLIIKTLIGLLIAGLAFALGFSNIPWGLFFLNEAVIMLSVGLSYAIVFILACIWLIEKRWLLFYGFVLAWLFFILLFLLFFSSDFRLMVLLPLAWVAPLTAILGCFWKRARKWGLLAFFSFTEILLIFIAWLFY